MKSFLNKALQTLTKRRRAPAPPPARKARLQLEQLEDRSVPAVNLAANALPVGADFTSSRVAAPCSIASPVRPVHEGSNYAVLFSGGVNTYKNHNHYYDNIKSLYQTLVGRQCNVPREHISIIYADGTDPAVDRPDGKNSDMSYAAGSTVLSATRTHAFDTLDTLAREVTTNDHFLFYSFDHGDGKLKAPSVEGEEALSGWGEDIQDNELAPRLNAIRAAHSTYVFAECFGGGMLDDLLPLGQGDFGCAATNHYEWSWYDGFAAGFVAALQQGFTDTYPVFQYAKSHDPFASTMAYPANGGTDLGTEHPWAVGENFKIFLTQQTPPTPPPYSPPLFDWTIVETSVVVANVADPESADLSSLATPEAARLVETRVTERAPIAHGNLPLPQAPVKAGRAPGPDAVDAVFAGKAATHAVTPSVLANAFAASQLPELTSPLDQVL